MVVTVVFYTSVFYAAFAARWLIQRCAGDLVVRLQHMRLLDPLRSGLYVICFNLTHFQLYLYLATLAWPVDVFLDKR